MCARRSPPRCMFSSSGAFSVLAAPFVSIEERGSDNVPTLFMRFPRRTQLPAPQKCSSVKWGSGGTWLLKDQGASRRSFSKATAPGDFLVPFASLQKELAAAAAKSLFCYRGMFRLPLHDDLHLGFRTYAACGEEKSGKFLIIGADLSVGCPVRHISQPAFFVKACRLYYTNPFF